MLEEDHERSAARKDRLTPREGSVTRFSTTAFPPSDDTRESIFIEFPFCSCGSFFVLLEDFRLLRS
jgi:hypothetical protein